MSRPLAIAFLGVALIVAGMVSADAGPGDMKIGLVDLERTLVETPAGKRASKAFDQVRKKKQGELDAKQKSFQNAMAQFEKQKGILKPNVARQKQQELQKRYLEIQELFVKLERDLAAERAKLIQNLLKKAAPVIKKIAERDGYAIVVDASAVLWADKSSDLTAKVNRELK